MRYKWFAKVCFLITFFCFAQEDRKLLETAKLLSRDVLTKTGYCSDGSDRAKNGQARFSGPMEAKIISFKGYDYVSYYESNGEVIIARKKHANDSKWQKSILQGYRVQSNDRHNKIAIAISKGDGVIHLSFDHHNSKVLNYARTAVDVAKHPEDIIWDDHTFSLQSNLGLKKDFGLVTYPAFTTINESGNLIIYWRSGGAIKGEMNLAKYDSKNHLWSFIGLISTKDGEYQGIKGTRGPYPAKIIEDGKGYLHIAWLWREDLMDRNVSNVLGNHGLYYAQSKDEGATWQNTYGETVASVENGLKMGIDNIGQPAVDIPLLLNPSNVGLSSAINPMNQDFYVTVRHNTKEAGRESNFVYKRTQDGEWSSKTMEIGGNYKLVFSNDYLFCFYPDQIQYATGNNGFEDWRKINLPVELKEGMINWNTTDIERGKVSMTIQYNPVKLGAPTPIEVLSFNLFEEN